MRPWFRVPAFLPLLEPGEAAARVLVYVGTVEEMDEVFAAARREVKL